MARKRVNTIFAGIGNYAQEIFSTGMLDVGCRMSDARSRWPTTIQIQVQNSFGRLTAMKLLRYGPPGEERPGLLDSAGHIRSLAGVVDDIAGAALGRASLD